MAAQGTIGGIRDWVIHRLVANYWSLPLVAVLVAPLAAALVLWIDAQGAGEWIHDEGLALFSAADTAQDVAAAIVGVNAAFLTLYWSIVLIVLTLAAGNLGNRLVDRWLDKRLVRRSMAGLTFCLVFSVIVFTRIDALEPIEQVAHFALTVLLTLAAVNTALLGVAIHDLGRTMFVDRAIAHLGREAQSVAVRVAQAVPHEGAWAHVIPAPLTGYVQSIDLTSAAKALQRHSGRVRFCAAPGQFVLKGEALVRFENRPPEDAAILDAIPIGDFRSSVQSTVYQVRLLVEVAARALSPGINDFYTALACTDQLAQAISGHAATWVDDARIAVDEDEPRFELPGQDFRGLFEGPLKAFRQSASSYPSVTIRMIDNYARLRLLLVERRAAAGLLAHLETLATQLHDHALERTDFAPDREDIEAALTRLRRLDIAQRVG
ncbi:MAG: DUF2254 domain-containing protein [Alphaproteobacteria bacterium]|nr:DUF2254 domain-containing protein [Alphaproteobacteria bacterium]MBU1606130.1 DUF2254 domain-containing protein [Alphaproteobacteria bacterium]